MTLFMFSNFFYLWSVMSFSNAKPYRKPFYTNFFFTLNVVILWMLNICMIIFNTSEFWVDQYINVINNFNFIFGLSINQFKIILLLF